MGPMPGCSLVLSRNGTILARFIHPGEGVFLFWQGQGGKSEAAAAWRDAIKSNPAVFGKGCAPSPRFGAHSFIETHSPWLGVLLLLGLLLLAVTSPLARQSPQGVSPHRRKQDAVTTPKPRRLRFHDNHDDDSRPRFRRVVACNSATRKRCACRLFWNAAHAPFAPRGFRFHGFARPPRLVVAIAACQM